MFDALDWSLYIYLDARNDSLKPEHSPQMQPVNVKNVSGALVVKLWVASILLGVGLGKA